MLVKDKTMKSDFLSILMAGGGTGGHLLPGVALAQAILEIAPDARIRFLVPGTAVDHAIMEKSGFSYHTNPMRSLPSNPMLWLSFAKSFLLGSQATMRAFRLSQPDIVVGLGGYGALSAGLLARERRIPFVMIEANRTAGKVVRWLSHGSLRIYCNGPVQGVQPEKLKMLGLPIRSGLPIGRNLLCADKQSFTILVMGGSQGAAPINQSMCQALPFLRPFQDRVRFIHLCGEKAKGEVARCYESQGFSARVLSFHPEMGELYLASDLVISRAGGSTLAEITAIGLPCILIPFAKAAGGHQEANALQLSEKGAARLVRESELSGETLANILVELLASPALLQEMAARAREMGHPDASHDIARDLLSLVENASASRVLQKMCR